MDGELLRELYHELFHRTTPRRTPRCRYGDAAIVFLYLFSVVVHRSLRWAYEERHRPLWARQLVMPSYSQVMRRLDTDSVHECMAQMNARFRGRLGHSPEKAVDGKPLVVGVYSKDKEAKRGCLSQGHWARGYKLHAVVDAGGAVDAAAVTPLNAGESTVATELLETMPLDGTTVRGDANYDSSKLYETVARRGGRLIAPRRKPGCGLGHHPQHPHRLEAIAALESAASILTDHRRRRNRIEQTFGHLTNLPFGLAPLPNFVRSLRRVTRWVQAKILIYHLHLSLTRKQTEAA